MTSREIAEFTGKEHKNVLADIREMLDAIYGEGGSAEISAHLPERLAEKGLVTFTSTTEKSDRGPRNRLG
jgi:phage regulator Rha-like protein